MIKLKLVKATAKRAQRNVQELEQQLAAAKESEIKMLNYERRLMATKTETNPLPARHSILNRCVRRKLASLNNTEHLYYVGIFVSCMAGALALTYLVWMAML